MKLKLMGKCGYVGNCHEVEDDGENVMVGDCHGDDYCYCSSEWFVSMKH